uniref:Uncharacterized protein n=1 Tax=Theropithecus gelada TaxID=9565 RepID=A0A8D2EAU1_THEGE
MQKARRDGNCCVRHIWKYLLETGKKVRRLLQARCLSQHPPLSRPALWEAQAWPQPHCPVCLSFLPTPGAGGVSVVRTAVRGHTEGMHACVRAHLHVFTWPGHRQRCSHSSVHGPPCRCAHAQQGYIHRRVCVLTPGSGSPPTPHTIHSVPGAHTYLGAPGSLSPCHLCVHVCAHTCPGTPVCVHACPGTLGSPSPCHLRGTNRPPVCWDHCWHPRGPWLLV